MSRDPLPDDACRIPCNLCGAAEVEVLARKGREGDLLRTVICRQCGLVWSDPRPIEAHRYYTEEYRKDYKKVETPKPIHVYRAGRVALDRWRRIRRWVPGRGQVVDVGSGGGEFVYLMTRLGFRCTGIEPHVGYADYSIREYSLDVRPGLADDMELGAGEYDLVALWHTLEHTEDPGGLLALARRWLKPTGVLVVEVPNVAAVCQAPAHRFHRAHLYSFNPETLAGLGTKHGFCAESLELSSDGGNVTAIFRAAPPGQAPALPGPENYRRILGTVRSHTWWRHYLSRHPYIRPLKKLRNAWEERWATRKQIHAAEVLDSLYAREG